MLREQIPSNALMTVDNEHRGARRIAGRPWARAACCGYRRCRSFLKTYIDRLSFSFTDYLRNERDSSTELHQWIRRNYTSFRELELSLLPQQS